MKTTKVLVATALLAGLASIAFAGPNPLFTNQQGKNWKTAAQAQCAAPAVCANCRCAAMKKS
jgi:hypothetical protein